MQNDTTAKNLSSPSDSTHLSESSHTAPPRLEWEMSTTDWLAVIGAALGAFMAVLDIQITNASMREIQGSLGLDISEAGWISTAYLIAEVIAIPMSSLLSQIFGLRNYLLFNISFFMLSSILCGFSWNLGSMVSFRVLQGLSGGTLIPLAFQIILTQMPISKRTIGLAIFGMTATIAPTLGPTLGGWLTEHYGWRTIFWINMVPGVAMFYLIQKGLHKVKPKWELIKQIDFVGIGLLILALAPLTYLLEEGAHVEWFEDFEIKIAFLITAVAFPFFVLRELTIKYPVLDLRLFKNLNFSFSVLITTFSAIALYGGVYSLSIYLSQIQNYTAMQIGEVMMWVGVPQLFVMPLMPILMKRVDLRLLTFLGLGLFAYSNYLNTHLSMDYAGAEFRISLIFRAIGQPLFMIPLSQIGMADIVHEEAGHAAAIYNVMRNIGGSVGIALSGTFLVSRGDLHLSQHLEKISNFSTFVNERMFYFQKFFQSLGFDKPTSQIQTIKMMQQLSYRESLIQAFGDVFFIFSVGLALCCVILFITHKATVKEDAMGE